MEKSKTTMIQGNLVGTMLTVNLAEDVRDFYKEVVGWEVMY